MSREYNNEYLRRTANAVDGGDTPEGARILNNEYLRRISEGIGGIVKPETGKVDASKIDGVIPAANLPSFVDDVVEGYLYQGDFYSDSQHTYEITPEAGKIYVDLSADTSYRWGGSSYVAIGRTLDAASQAEAEAGQDNAKYMTPLRTKQAIDALTPSYSDAVASTAGQGGSHGLMSASDKEKLDGIEGGANAYSLPDMSASTKGGAKVGSGLEIDDGVLSTTDDLGITDATVGQYSQVAAVDADGKPTEWTAANGYTLTAEDMAEIEGVVESHLKATVTVTAIADDGTTVTGQTVTFRTLGGATYATMTYSGQPVSMSVPKGTDLVVSMSDAMPSHRVYGSQHVSVIDADVSVLFTYLSVDYTGLAYDSETGRYDNASIEAWLARHADGLTYGVSIPKSIATECQKTGANASMPNPVPGVIGRPAVDPYVGRGPFLFLEVNGGVEDDGTPYVTAIRHMDERFRRDGSNGDVWILVPHICWSVTETDEAVQIDVSDSKYETNDYLPKSHLPDGTLRPYLLLAKYAGVMGDDGYMHSYSGRRTWTGNVSHDSLRTQCRTATTGYAGKSVLDLLYWQLMFLLKYATKHGQSVFAGATNYNLTYNVTVAQESQDSVIISKANAANLVVGSSVTVGTAANGTQRCEAARILSIADYDASNSVVTLDAEPFTTAVNNKVSTFMWHSGSCDLVEGDGSPTDPLSPKEPYVIQGIECSVGCTEIIGDVIIYSDGTSGWIPYVNPDSRDEATSLTAVYVSGGKHLPMGTSDGWRYALYPESNGWFLMGTTTGGSETTGICDGQYVLRNSTTGVREFLSVGSVGPAGLAGPFFVTDSSALSSANWNIGSRLSATGRSRG